MNIVRRGVAATALVLCLVPGVAAYGPESRLRARSPQDPGAAPDTEAQELSWKARGLELDYRHRLGRLRRLRELAEKRGDTARVAEIDKLWHAAQRGHAEHVNRALLEKLDPATRARLDEELCQGRDPQELVEFRNQMKEQAAAHRQDMKEQRGEFRDKVKAEDAEHRASMQKEKEEFRAKMDAQNAEHRENVKDQRGEFYTKMKDQHDEFLKDRGEKRDDFRATAPDRRGAEREAARAAHERDWDEARDKARAEVGGKQREEALKRKAADRLDDDARKSREDRWRRAAARDGLGPDAAGKDRDITKAMRDGRFRMPTQKEADLIAGQDIDDDDADVEFELLKREIGAP